MVVGLCVVWGLDWILGDSDGGEGYLGMVVDVWEMEGVVGVVWDVGNIMICCIGKD